MSDYEVVEERGDYRVVLYPDIDSSDPRDNDGQSPLIRFYRDTAEHIAPTWKSGREDNIEGAARRWGPPNRDTWHLFETYMRAFHGTTQIETYYSGNHWYVTYDTTEWREDTGAPANSVDITEWKAYCEGEVYGYVVQKRVTWLAQDDAGAEYGTMETWDDVDSLWGFYGYDYAIRNARDALNYVVESESK